MAKSKELGMQAFDQTLLNLYYKARQHKRVRLHRQILPMIFGRLSSPRVVLKKFNPTREQSLVSQRKVRVGLGCPWLVRRNLQARFQESI
jgi:hypothetical protein